MLKIPAHAKIYLAHTPVDMRKAVAGLSALVNTLLSSDPFTANIFIFYNRSCTLIKALLWDKDGFLLLQKRLEKGHFKIPKQWVGDKIALSEREFTWLLSGLDFMLLRKRPELHFDDIF